MTNKLLVCDMDGVLVDFCRAAYNIHGRRFEGNEPNQFDFFKYDWGISAKDFWHPINEAGSNWWANIPYYKWTYDILSLLKGNSGGFIVATACSHHPHSAHGKVAALQRMFGDNFRDYCITPVKHFLGNENAILIDDNDENHRLFQENGGSSILFPQHWNENRHLVHNRIGYLHKELGKHAEQLQTN